VSTTEASSAQCHHHIYTHNKAYASRLINGAEVWHMTLHSALGDPTVGHTQNSPGDCVLTREYLLFSLQVLLGADDANFLSESQKSLVWHSINSMKHVHISTRCGGGKSMSWLLRVFALMLAKKDPGMSIIAVPYTYLVASHVKAARKLFT
jgi:hypothetical protein